MEKIIEGRTITDEELIEVTSGRGKASLREKIPQIKEGLKGTTREHHRKMIKLIYEHIKYLEEELKEIDKMIDEACKEYKKEIELLDSIPGIDEDSAKAIIEEIGEGYESTTEARYLDILKDRIIINLKMLQTIRKILQGNVDKSRKTINSFI